MNSSKNIVSKLFDLSPTKGNLKKLHIINAAIECLVTLGIDKTTFEAIAKKIGTRRAHVAYYFPNKDDIFLEVVKYISTNALDITETALLNSKKNSDLLTIYVKSAFIWGEQYPDQAKLLALFYYLCSFKEEYRQLNDQIQGNNERQLAIILHEKLKLSTDSKEAKEAARSVQHIMTGELIGAVTLTKGSYKKSKKNALQSVELIVQGIKSTLSI